MCTFCGGDSIEASTETFSAVPWLPLQEPRAWAAGTMHSALGFGGPACPTVGLWGGSAPTVGLAGFGQTWTLVDNFAHWHQHTHTETLAGASCSSHVLPCLCLSPPVASCLVFTPSALWGRNHGFALDLSVPCTMWPSSITTIPMCYCYTHK